MAISVFISWSGEKSRRIAEHITDWLPSVLQNFRPYYSPNDIDKGSKWSSEISRSLSECDAGVICLTRDNLDKAWLLFEAGALSKKLEESRVYTTLFGVEAGDIKYPLAIFQNTLFVKEDFRKLIGSINMLSRENPLTDKTLDLIFEKMWPDLEAEIQKILNEDTGAKKPRRSDRDILEEILDLSRQASKIDQNSGTAARPIALSSAALEDLFETARFLINISQEQSSLDIAEHAVRIAAIARYFARYSSSTLREAANELHAEAVAKKDDIIPF